MCNLGFSFFLLGVSAPFFGLVCALFSTLIPGQGF